jgi:hypothetical protein
MTGRAVNDDQGELFATLIEVTLEERDGGTALTIRQLYFEPMPPGRSAWRCGARLERTTRQARATSRALTEENRTVADTYAHSGVLAAI